MYSFTEYDSIMKRKDCFATFIIGILGCLWRRKQFEVTNSKCDNLWLTLLILISLLTGFVLYCWVVAGNSTDDFSWTLFKSLGKWVYVQLIAVILTAILCAYLLLLFVLSLCHLAFGYRVYMSISHRIVLIILLGYTIATLVYMTVAWPAGWDLQALSLMITAPFLHITVVAIMTACSWFILESVFIDLLRKDKALAIVGFLIFGVVMLTLYLVPLAIKSPCICEDPDLPSKPQFFAHRGASAIAPENTVLSFEIAAQFEETVALESDVLVSYDGVPFLMHDVNLRRTTDVATKFPGREMEPAANFNMSEIESLNAGSWFLQQNPFRTTSSLSEEEKENIQKNIKVPTLVELLDVAVKYNKYIIFDLTSADYDDGISADHPYLNNYQDVVISTILNHNISQSKVYWLYTGIFNSTVANNFTRMYGKKDTYSDLIQLSDININLPFQKASLSEVRSYQKNNISVNVWVVNSRWLYSLYWCMGVDSVTTNLAHSFVHVKNPVWQLTPMQFLGMWLGTDAVSICFIIIVFVIQRKRHLIESSGNEMVALDDRDINYTGL